MTASLRMVLLAGAALLPCVSARAADVTADQGRAAEAAVRAWVNGMLGPAVTLSASPITLTPAGDHFDMTMPVVTLPGQPAAKGATMAQVRPLDDGKWAVDDMHVTMPMTFNVVIPVPADAKADEKKPEDKATPERRPGTGAQAQRRPEAKTPAERRAEELAGKGKPPGADATAPKSMTVQYTVDIVGQDGHGVLDPTLATASTLTNTAKSATIHTVGGPTPSDTTLGAYASSMTAQPSGTDSVDLKLDGTLQDYHMVTADAAPVQFKLDMKTLKVAMAVLGLNRAKAQAVTRATTSLVAAQSAQSGVPGAPKIGPELITAMLVALKDSASEVSLNEEVDGLALNSSGVPVTIGKAGFAIDAKSADGLLDAHMPIELRDIGVQGVLPPDLAALLPTVVALRPSISNVGVAELSRIAASYNKTEPSPSDVEALFSHGGVKLGLDSMSVGFAGALFEGEGAMTLTSPSDGSGTMRVTATGFDTMMQKISAIPSISGQAVPALAFVKGIGKVDGSKIVWDIVYKDGKALVNNVDMSSLTGGAGGQARPPGGRVIPK